MNNNMYKSNKLDGGIHLDPKSLTFSIFTAEDIRNISVKKIVKPECFTPLGYPVNGGLHDGALGTYYYLSLTLHNQKLKN